MTGVGIGRWFAGKDARATAGSAAGSPPDGGSRRDAVLPPGYADEPPVRVRAPRPPRRASPADAAVGEAAALTQARRRLLGATVLLAIGLIVFPWLLDTEPRPVSMELPVRLAGSGEPAGPAATSRPAPALATPVTPAATATAPPSPTLVTPASPPRAGAGPRVQAPVTAAEPSARETRQDDPRQAVDGPAAATTASKVAVAPTSSPAAAVAASAPATPSTPSTPATVSPPVAARSTATPAAPARPGVAGTPSAPPVPHTAVAALPPTPPSVAARAPRYVVQIGAFSDPASAQQARARAERLGLTTYTHVVDVAGGQRIRVRVGPMSDRDEAQRVLERLRQAGLPGAVLAL